MTARQIRHTTVRFWTKSRKLRRAYEPIMMLGGIADQGRGAADVGGEDLGHEEGDRVDLERQGDLDGDRNDQQHRRDVVEERGGHRGDDHEDRRQREDVAAGELERLVGHPLEDAGLLEHADDDHHGHQQEDHVHVDGADGILEGEDAVRGIEGPCGVGEEEEQGSAEERRQACGA